MPTTLSMMEVNALSEALALWRRRMVARGWIPNTFVRASAHRKVVWDYEF